MLRFALRRILWLAPALVAITMLMFWGISRALSPAGGLPLFFNPAPRDVRASTHEAAEQLARGGSEAERGARELVRLGGAALPHLLPKLDSFAPKARARIALALAPVGDRMGLSGSAERRNPAEAARFWNRYWQDHSIDFRPAAAKRAIRRFSEHPSSLRRAEVVSFDTYALSALMAELGRAHERQDIALARRLSTVAAHMTGHPWIVGAGMTQEQAAAVLTTWLGWWSAHRAAFITFDGPRRVEGMVRETQYGRWAAALARGGFGSLSDGRSVGEVFVSRGKVTLWILLSGLLLGYAFGIALGAATASLRSSIFDRIVGAVAIALVGLPAALFVQLLSPIPSRAISMGAALSLTAIVAAMLVSRHHRLAQARQHRQESTLSEHAFGLSPLRIAIRKARASAGVSIALATTDVPTLLTTAFVAEHAFELPGLGPATVRAVHEGEVAWLMIVAISAALLVGVLQIGADLFFRLLDPRAQLAAARQRGATL